MAKNVHAGENYAGLKQKAQSNLKLRQSVYIAVAVTIVVYAGLAYSLCYVQPGDAEYYISLITLALNTLLFAGLMITAIVLRRRGDRYIKRMEELDREDKADPWIVNRKK